MVSSIVKWNGSSEHFPVSAGKLGEHICVQKGRQQIHIAGKKRKHLCTCCWSWEKIITRGSGKSAWPPWTDPPRKCVRGRQGVGWGEARKARSVWKHPRLQKQPHLRVVCKLKDESRQIVFQKQFLLSLFVGNLSNCTFTLEVCNLGEVLTLGSDSPGSRYYFCQWFGEVVGPPWFFTPGWQLSHLEPDHGSHLLARVVFLFLRFSVSAPHLYRPFSGVWHCTVWHTDGPGLCS